MDIYTLWIVWLKIDEWMLHPFFDHLRHPNPATATLLFTIFEISANLLITITIFALTRKLKYTSTSRISFSTLIATAGLYIADYAGSRSIEAKIALTGFYLNVPLVYSMMVALTFPFICVLNLHLMLRLAWRQSIIAGVIVSLCLIPLAYHLELIHITDY